MKQQKRRTSPGACARIEPLISMYVDGELNTRRAKAVGAHLDICPACAAKAKELSELSELLKLSAESDATCEMSADVHASIMRSVAQSPRQSEHKSVRRGLWRTGAALIGVFLICGVLLMPGGPLNPVANAPSYDADSSTGGQNGGIFDGAESPEASLPGADSPNDDEMDSDGASKGDSVVYHLFRADGEAEEPLPPGADSPSYDGEGEVEGGIDEELLEQLHGEWKNNEMHLLLNTESMLFGLVMDDGTEYWGVIIWYYDVLRLIPDGEAGVKFEVSVRGDELWLTKLS